MKKEMRMKKCKCVILISSYDNCGKDTLADKLITVFKNEGYSTLKISFAQPLYEKLSELSGIPVPDLHKYKRQDVEIYIKNVSSPATVREHLISIAKNIRKSDPYYFLKKVVNVIKENNPDIVIIPDMRYMLESKIGKYLDEYVVVKIFMHSELESCNKNGLRYELDKIDYDIEITLPYGLEKLDKYINTYLKDILLEACTKKHTYRDN